MTGGSLTIAFDFDGTYTAAPDLWDECLRLFHQAGHQIICVTGRGDHHHPTAEEVIAERFTVIPVPVIRANRYGSKRKAVAAEGYEVDIWIDDEPWGIQPSEADKRKGKRRQKIRSSLSRELPKGIGFEEYIEALRIQGIP